jgi:small conductance mechanosensitive channel
MTDATNRLAAIAAPAETFAWSKFIDTAGDLAINLAVAAAILAVTIWLAGWANRVMRAALGRVHPRRGAADVTLQTFAGSMARNLVLVVGLVAVLQQLGVRTTSIIAVLGAASLAIGLALQGALSNVAAGVMILLFRPYRVGDIIETGGKVGRVEALDLFVTELATLDNLKVVIPNSKVFGDVVVNHTHHDRRRADVSLRLPATVDAAALIDRLRQRLNEDPRVLKEPAPILELTGVGEAWAELTVRPWTDRENYGRVKADVLLWAKLLEKDLQAALPATADVEGERPREEQRPRPALA